MRRNAYLDRQRAERRMRDRIVESWSVQLAADTWSIVLNDPDVMGRGRLGRKRLRRVLAAFDERYAKNRDGLTNSPTASYTRAQVDKDLKRIGKEDFIPWEERLDNWDDSGI